MTKLTVADCITAAWLDLSERHAERPELIKRVKDASLLQPYCGLLTAMDEPSLQWAHNVVEARLQHD